MSTSFTTASDRIRIGAHHDRFEVQAVLGFSKMKEQRVSGTRKLTKDFALLFFFSFVCLLEGGGGVGGSSPKGDRTD